MSLHRVLLLTLALLSFAPRPARAQGFISPTLGYAFGADTPTCVSLTNCDDRRLSWGVSMGKMGETVGFEQEFVYGKDFFGKSNLGDSAMLTIMSNLMLILPAGPIRPYGVFGVGLMRPHVKFDTSSLELSQTALGWDFGGGLNIFFTHGFGIRGDVRRLKTFQDITLGVFGNDQLKFWRGSTGVTFRF